MNGSRTTEGFAAIQTDPTSQIRTEEDSTIGPFHIGLLTGEAVRTANLHPNDPALDNHLVFMLSGSCLVDSDHQNPVLLTSQSAGVFFNHDQCSITIGRGEFELLLLSWKNDDFIAVKEDVIALQNSQQALRGLHLVNAPHQLNNLGQKAADLVRSENENASTLLTAFVALVIHGLKSSDYGIVLADMPESAPDALIKLLQDVKKTPERRWALKEAADQASYSAFHLSRVFRTIAPYGFPEFVDRCRAERAIAMLLETDMSADDIVAECGYGSNQRLRASLREHVGFLPSELRKHLPQD